MAEILNFPQASQLSQVEKDCAIIRSALLSGIIVFAEIIRRDDAPQWKQELRDIELALQALRNLEVEIASF